MRYVARIAMLLVALTLTNPTLASSPPASHELSPVLQQQQQRLVVFEEFSSPG